MIKLLITTFLLIVINCSVVFAESNWEWIESNDYYGKFIDSNSIEIHREPISNRLDYIYVWAKIVYSYEGARRHCNSYNLKLSPDNLSYSLMKLKLNPRYSQVIRERIVFYDKNNEVLYENRNDNNSFDVYYHKFYAPYLYYTVDKITDNHEYLRYKSNERYKYFVSTELNEKENYFEYLDTMTMRNHNDYYSGYFWQVFQDKNTKERVAVWLSELKFDKNKKTIESQRIYLRNGENEYWRYDIPFELRQKEKEECIPDSFGEQLRDNVVAYFDSNFSWANRYNEGVYAGKF